MRLMSAKKLKGQIAGEVPQDLIDAFDACVDRLGVTKKRGIAAAVMDCLPQRRVPRADDFPGIRSGAGAQLRGM